MEKLSIKRGVVLLLLFVMLVQCVSADSVLVRVNGGTDVRIEATRTNPAPVGPGESFDLWLSIQNVGSTSGTSAVDLDDVEIELVEDFPFTLQNSEDAIKELGNLAEGESVTVKYELRVDKDVYAGENELHFIVKHSNNPTGIESSGLVIDVEVVDTTLDIVSVDTDPDELEPGQIAEIEITVMNNAYSLFRNLEMELESAASVPIIPYQMTNKLTLRQLDSGEAHTFTYYVITDESATAGVYSVPFLFTYDDVLGTTHTSNETFALLISSKPDLEFNIEEFDTFTKGSTGNVVVSISNTGSSDLKFMTLELLDGEGYTVLSTNKEYLGNVDSDDFETSSFDLYVSEGDVDLNLQVSYKDAYNTEFVENVSLTLPVYDSAEIQLFGLNGNGSSYSWLFYLIIIVFAYFVIQGWRREKIVDKALKHGLVELIKLPFRILFFFRWKNVRTWPRKLQKFFKSI